VCSLVHVLRKQRCSVQCQRIHEQLPCACVMDNCGGSCNVKLVLHRAVSTATPTLQQYYIPNNRALMTNSMYSAVQAEKMLLSAYTQSLHTYLRPQASTTPRKARQLSLILGYKLSVFSMIRVTYKSSVTDSNTC
jgi:hypothetical protein